MQPKTEQLDDRHRWLRIADPGWTNPLDPTFAAEIGGRWNPSGGHPTLYLNEDVVTARLNLRAWAANWPWEPEDLRPEHAPVLVEATLPRNQTVADGHTPSGVKALGLPVSYPQHANGRPVSHDTCQPIGTEVHARGLRGIRARSAQTPLGAGRELAWFPASQRSKASQQSVRSFDDWYWS